MAKNEILVWGDGEPVTITITACKGKHPIAPPVEVPEVVEEKSEAEELLPVETNDETSDEVKDIIDDEKPVINETQKPTVIEEEYKDPSILPIIVPRYHGPGCSMEIGILEKHHSKCRFKKLDNEFRHPVDDKAGSFEFIGRMSFKTCGANEPNEQVVTYETPVNDYDDADRVSETSLDQVVVQAEDVPEAGQNEVQNYESPPSVQEPEPNVPVRPKEQVQFMEVKDKGPSSKYKRVQERISEPFKTIPVPAGSEFTVEYCKLKKVLYNDNSVTVQTMALMPYNANRDIWSSFFCGEFCLLKKLQENEVAKVNTIAHTETNHLTTANKLSQCPSRSIVKPRWPKFFACVNYKPREYSQ